MQLVIQEPVIKIIMKKTILILTAILAICGGSYYYYMQSEKKMLCDFAHDVIDNSIKLDDVIVKHIKCSKEEKKMATYILEYYRDEYIKNPSNNISIYSYEEAVEQKIIEDNIVSENYDNVFVVFLNHKNTIEVLLNSDSKIIAISTINKGGTRFFMRLDGEKD
jgi:hypothetical protein